MSISRCLAEVQLQQSPTLTCRYRTPAQYPVITDILRELASYCRVVQSHRVRCIHMRDDQ